MDTLLDELSQLISASNDNEINTWCAAVWL